MDQVSIKLPLKPHPVTGARAVEISPSGLFVVWGQADPSVVSVRGQCTTSKATVTGNAHHYLWDVTRRRYRWAVVFRFKREHIQPPGTDDTFSVSITAYSAQGPRKPGIEVGRFEINQFPVRWVDSRKPVGQLEPSIAVSGSITIEWPSQDQDISDYADDFRPWGTISGNPLGTVQLSDTDNPGQSPTPLNTFSDCIDLQYWCAQFPTLVDKHYDLYVSDSEDTASDSVTGLFIT